MTVTNNNIKMYVTDSLLLKSKKNTSGFVFVSFNKGIADLIGTRSLYANIDKS